MHAAALTLGLSSLALAVFPLVRPFFSFDPTTPAETLAGASRAVTSTPWLIAHYIALIGFVLLLCVLPALYARLATAGVESPARRAMLLSGVGVALILPTLGVELYALPAIGRVYLEGNQSVAALVGLIYRGAAVLVMLLGLLLLALGAVILARAVGKTGALPRWAAVTYAVGLAFWCPLLPPPVRIVDGLLIGAGGLGLAWALRRSPPHPQPPHPQPPHPTLSPQGRG
jgi:hypothetical protein